MISIKQGWQWQARARQKHVWMCEMVKLMQRHLMALHRTIINASG